MGKHLLFKDRVAVLATMHQKEKVIAPILERELGIKVVVPPKLNTDLFGTFTREIERVGNQLEVARLKAEKAMALTGETMALASEGAFSPHPNCSFIPCNRELVIFLDQTNRLEIVGHELSVETNYSHQLVRSIQEANESSLKVGFPDHGLIVMSDQSYQTKVEIIKGITTEEQLFEAVKFILDQTPNGKAHIETDMRALYNPTRKKNIEKATYDLVNKINHLCPGCGWPGFELIERKKGLPCGHCNLPTEATRSVIYHCKGCSFNQETIFPEGFEKADPAQCFYCNP